MTFQVGAKVRSKTSGKTGTFKGVHGPMVDVQMDGESFVRRCAANTLERVQKNPAPRVRKNPAQEVVGGYSIEVWDPNKEQFHAQAQAIYESLVRKKLGLKTTGGIGLGWNRLDLALEHGERKALFGQAFAIATKSGRRSNHLVAEGMQLPTAKGQTRVRERLADSVHLAENRQDFETTLALCRNGAFYRVVQEGTKYVVWPKPFNGLPPIAASFPSASSAVTAAKKAEQSLNAFIQQNLAR